MRENRVSIVEVEEGYGSGGDKTSYLDLPGLAKKDAREGCSAHLVQVFRKFFTDSIGPLLALLRGPFKG